MGADGPIRIESLARRAVLAKVMIALWMVLAGTMVVLSALILKAQIALEMPMSMVVPLTGLLVLPTMAVTLVNSLVFLLWVYRASRNLVDAGIADLDHSPGWNGGSYFVPFVNLVVPFRAMRELHNRSRGEDVWQARADVGDVSAWWSCYVGGLVIQIALAFVAFVNFIPRVYLTTPLGVNTALGIFASLLLVGSQAFQWKIISAITNAQRSLKHVGGVFD